MLARVRAAAAGVAVAKAPITRRDRVLGTHRVRDIRDQCLDANVSFFFKQWGGRTPKAGGRELDGRTWDQMPQQ